MAPPTPWACSATEVVQALAVDPEAGLSTAEADERLAAVGPNTLQTIRPRSWWAILVAQVSSLLVVLLSGACLAAAAYGEFVEAAAIAGVVVLNTLLGFFTELKAVRSVEALREMGCAESPALRDGQIVVLEASQLVPGDIVLLEGGDVVSADARIIEASKLQVDESTLTGESLPLSKGEAPVAQEASIGDRRSMLYKGTVVTRGSAEAVVVATAMASELGQISKLVEEAEEETTPLERRLDRLGRGLIWVTLAVATLVAIAGFVAGKPAFLVIETAIALAVAAVPEGLPIIATIALARGMHRMVRHDALVNRLSSVETLGATSVICTDKTGTLTENKIRVADVVLAAEPDARRRALEIGVLCNNAIVGLGLDDVGDPIEVALLRWGEEEGVDRLELLQQEPELRESAFDPELKMMATVHGTAAPFRVAVKGAPEAVLKNCTLTAEERAHWLQEAERLAGVGQRVLGVAERSTADPETSDVYVDLRFVGLIGMHDPPRLGVRDTVAACRNAGVRLVMVTGDHPKTAVNIAQKTGLVDGEDAEAVSGEALEDASPPSELREHLLSARVFARVSPKQKLNLITLHQASGAIVAMTGDGVNDAPALRKADIGVAMGGRGTAAAREAGDMILLDDDLSTVVVAIAEGRTIFANIQKFVVYLMSCNLSEVMVVAVAVAVGAPLPLLPLQILFLNLVTDVFPALALGVGGGADHVMERPPRDAAQPVISSQHWRAIGGYGLLITASVLSAMAIAMRVLGLGVESAVTVSFLTLAFAQLWHVFNMRNTNSRFFSNEITRNLWVWGALALCVVILLTATYVSPVANLLSVVPPTLEQWGLILGMSALPLVLVQTWRLIAGARS